MATLYHNYVSLVQFSSKRFWKSKQQNNFYHHICFFKAFVFAIENSRALMLFLCEGFSPLITRLLFDIFTYYYVFFFILFHFNLIYLTSSVWPKFRTSFVRFNKNKIFHPEKHFNLNCTSLRKLQDIILSFKICNGFFTTLFIFIID